jgi:ubiquinone/menaquinone biosynthesis C-methylase UbiE
MAATDHSQEKYILATGEQAAERLFLLNEIFGPGTRELLLVAGISPGMCVVEIGCGTGLVSLWMAQVVGAGGSVTAMDVSNDQLRVAERNAAAAGATNVTFRAASAYDTRLPRQSFDLVYSRFLMCHLTEPLKALAEMRRLLKSGGVLVCEDHDDGGIFTEPPTRAYKRLVEISEAVNQSSWP